MKDIIKIFALGGLDENGKNMYVLEINDDIFVLDAGIKYPEQSMMGIDIIIPDSNYLIVNKDKVKAYIISHGHDDVMGALPYIIQNVPAPIYTTKITSYLIQDAARRFKVDCKFDFRIVHTDEDIEIAGRMFHFFPTTHSACESVGVAIETTQGQIVYTTDFIMDFGSPLLYRTDLRRLAKIADIGVLCLMCESSNADMPGHTSPNHKLIPHIENIFEDHKGRIIIAVYTQNLYGIGEILYLCKKNRKRVLFYSREMQNMMQKFIELGIYQIPSSMLVSYDALTKPGNSDIVIIATGIGEKLYRVLEKMSQGDADKNFIPQTTDHFIIAASLVPGIEVVGAKIIDEIYRTGASVSNVSRKKVLGMHAHEEDIKLLLSLLKPTYYMPIKGEYRHLVANAQIAMSMNLGYNHNSVLVYDNGMVAQFEDGKYKGIIADETHGEVLVDGLGVGDVGNMVITDRQKLADDGVVVVGITIDTKTKEIIAGPDVQMRGLIFLKDADYILKELAKIMTTEIEDFFTSFKIDLTDTKMTIRDKMIKYIRRETGKMPMVLPVVIEI
jgi:ribonuclease J